MRTPRIIIAALVSGRVKLTPEVLEVLKRHGHNEKVKENEQPHEGETPAPPTPEDRSSASPPQTVSVSPVPGRWIRVCTMALGCLALWLALPTRGQESDFDAANRACAEGKWAEAARGYETVIVRHGYSAPVLFNLANARFREGKLGSAILDYERARWLAPNDPDIAANLALVRQKAGLEPETFSRLAALAHSMTCTGWSILAAAMLWLIMAALPLRQVLPRARPALTIGAIIGTVVFLAAIGALTLRWPDVHRAVVTAPEAAARVSPVTLIQPLFTLRAGESVRVKDTHGGFVLIATREGREGWVSREAVTPVVQSGRAS